MTNANKVWVKELDLKGEVCPYTFVKTKLALEMMESGEVLRVLIDYPSSADNVPRSAAGEGHKVIEIEQTGEHEWAIIIEKA